MASSEGVRVLTDAQWAALKPLVLEVRPRGKTPHADLRRTMEAIIWRHNNGAKWRSNPDGTRSVVGSGADVHPLGQVGRVGTLAGTGPSPCRRG